MNVPTADEGLLWRRTKIALTPALSRKRERGKGAREDGLGRIEGATR